MREYGVKQSQVNKIIREHVMRRLRKLEEAEKGDKAVQRERDARKKEEKLAKKVKPQKAPKKVVKIERATNYSGTSSFVGLAFVCRADRTPAGGGICVWRARCCCCCLLLLLYASLPSRVDPYPMGTTNSERLYSCTAYATSCPDGAVHMVSF